MNVESEKRLHELFGGEAIIIYQPWSNDYQISIRNDDLVNDFHYVMHNEDTLTKARKQAKIKDMLYKYIKHMEIEQQLMKKGLLKSEKDN